MRIIIDDNNYILNKKNKRNFGSFDFVIRTSKRTKSSLKEVDCFIVYKNEFYLLGEAYLYERNQDTYTESSSLVRKFFGAVGNTIFRKEFYFLINQASVYVNIFEILGKQKSTYCLEQLQEIGFLGFYNPEKHSNLKNNFEKLTILRQGNNLNYSNRLDEHFFLNLIENSSKNSVLLKNIMSKTSTRLSRNEFKVNIDILLTGFDSNHKLQITLGNARKGIVQNTYLFIGSNGLGKTQCLQNLFNNIYENNSIQSNLRWFGFNKPKK